jgi:hypothetical protein
MSSARLPFYRVWFLKIWLGMYGQTFNDYVHKCFQARYYGIKLDPFRHDFMLRDDVQRYHRENMAYRWTARHKLGAIDLGSCTLSQALKKLSELQPESTVRYVDDNLPFIFFKPKGESND